VFFWEGWGGGGAKTSLKTSTKESAARSRNYPSDFIYLTERVTSVSIKFKCVLPGFKWYFTSYTGRYSEENKTKNYVIHFKLIHGGMLPCFVLYYF